MRFRQWVRQCIFKQIIRELAQDLYERDKIGIRKAFIDGTFVPAKRGLAMAAHVESARPHEVKPVEQTMDSGFTSYTPDKLIGDKA